MRHLVQRLAQKESTKAKKMLSQEDLYYNPQATSDYATMMPDFVKKETLFGVLRDRYGSILS